MQKNCNYRCLATWRLTSASLDTAKARVKIIAGTSVAAGPAPAAAGLEVARAAGGFAQTAVAAQAVAAAGGIAVGPAGASAAAAPAAVEGVAAAGAHAGHGAAGCEGTREG